MIPPPESARPNPVVRAWSSSGVRYLVVGGFCFLVDVGLLWFAHEVLHIALPLATALAFLISFAVTYTTQRLISFASTARIAPSVARYTALVAFNTVATTVIVWGISAVGIPWLWGKVAAVVATTVWNYFLYRYWVFATPKGTSG